MPFNCLLYILPIIYTTCLLCRVQIELQNIPRSAFPLSTDRLHLFLNLLLLQVLPIFPPDYKSYFRPSTNHISTRIQIIFLPKYKSFLSAASQALTRAPAKGPDPCSKSKYGRLKLRDWSWICEKTNWDLWRAERRICEKWKVAPDVKFTQTDYLVQNLSPPLMIVNFLFCDELLISTRRRRRRWRYWSALCCNQLDQCAATFRRTSAQSRHFHSLAILTN